MATPPSPVQKVCTVCKADVSQVKRIKDDQGRYYCHPCWGKTHPKPQDDYELAPVPVSRPAKSAPPPPPGDLAAVSRDSASSSAPVDAPNDPSNAVPSDLIRCPQCRGMFVVGKMKNAEGMLFCEECFASRRPSSTLAPRKRLPRWAFYSALGGCFLVGLVGIIVLCEYQSYVTAIFGRASESHSSKSASGQASTGGPAAHPTAKQATERLTALHTMLKRTNSDLEVGIKRDEFAERVRALKFEAEECAGKLGTDDIEKGPFVFLRLAVQAYGLSLHEWDAKINAPTNTDHEKLMQLLWGFAGNCVKDAARSMEEGDRWQDAAHQREEAQRTLETAVQTSKKLDELSTKSLADIVDEDPFVSSFLSRHPDLAFDFKHLDKSRASRLNTTLMLLLSTQDIDLETERYLSKFISAHTPAAPH